MPYSPPPSPDPGPKRIDVRALSLSQLQKLASKGSRRARAELEQRMHAAQPLPSRAELEQRMRAASAPPRPADLPPPPQPARMALDAGAPDATEARAASLPAAPPSAAPGESATSKELLLQQQFEVIALQERAHDGADGPPRLMGLVLIGWGVLLLLGGLVLLTHRGGFYYVLCALGTAAVGWLLMRCSRWAMTLHAVLVLGALIGAWRSAGGSFVSTLVLAAPVWMAALWMAAPPVREPLE